MFIIFFFKGCVCIIIIIIIFYFSLFYPNSKPGLVTPLGTPTQMTI